MKDSDVRRTMHTLAWKAVVLSGLAAFMIGAAGCPPQIKNLEFSDQIVSDADELDWQRLWFDCRDQDGDLLAGQVWIRLTGTPVTDPSWFSLSAGEFSIDSSTGWQYDKGGYIFRIGGISSRIDLKTAGTVTAQVYLRDSSGNASPTVTASFLVSPRVYYYVYADFTWGAGIPQAFVEIVPLSGSPDFYSYGQIYGRGGSITFEGEIPVGIYMVKFHNLGEYSSGGDYTACLGNPDDSDVTCWDGTWGFFSQDTVGLEDHFILDTVNGRVID